MDCLVSRLESGRAILENPPHVAPSGFSLLSLRPKRGAGGKEIPMTWQGQMRGFFPPLPPGLFQRRRAARIFPIASRALDAS